MNNNYNNRRNVWADPADREDPERPRGGACAAPTPTPWNQFIEQWIKSMKSIISRWRRAMTSPIDTPIMQINNDAAFHSFWFVDDNNTCMHQHWIVLNNK